MPSHEIMAKAHYDHGHSNSSTGPRLPSPPVESSSDYGHAGAPRAATPPPQPIRLLADVALSGFHIPRRSGSSRGFSQRKIAIKLPSIMTLTGETHRSMTHTASTDNSEGGRGTKAPRWEYVAAAAGDRQQGKIASPAEGVPPNRPVRHASPALLRSADSRTELRISTPYHPTPLQDRSSSSTHFDARTSAPPHHHGRSHSLYYRRASPCPPAWGTPTPYELWGGSSSTQAKCHGTRPAANGAATSGDTSGNAPPLSTVTVFYDGLPSPAYETMPMPSTHGYSGEHSHGPAQNDGQISGQIKRHIPSTNGPLRGSVSAGGVASEQVRHLGAVVHTQPRAGTMLARPQTKSYAAAAAALAASTPATVHPGHAVSEPPARGHDFRRHSNLQSLWAVDTGRRDVPWRESAFEHEHEAQRGRKRERGHGKVQGNESPLRRSCVTVGRSSASTPAQKQSSLSEGVTNGHSKLGLFDAPQDETSSQVEDDSDHRGDSSEEEYAPGGKRHSGAKGGSRGTRASQRLRGRESAGPAVHATNGLGIVTGPAAEHGVKPVSPESAFAPLCDDGDGGDGEGTPAPDDNDARPQKRTYVRRDAQRRKEQNAQAQRKFRYKKKAMAEQMRLDLEEQRKLVEELQAQYAALDAAMAKTHGELGKVRAENKSLKRRLEEYAVKSPDVIKREEAPASEVVDG